MKSNAKIAKRLQFHGKLPIYRVGRFSNSGEDVTIRWAKSINMPGG